MRFRRLSALVVKELKMLISDRASAFWLIAWPLVWIILVAYVFVPPGSGTPISIDVGIVNLDRSSLGNTGFKSADLINIMDMVTYNGSKLFNVKLYNDTEALIGDLKKGRIDVGMIIPEDFSSRLAFGTAELRVLIGGRDSYSSSINYAAISSFINELNRRIALLKVNASMRYIEKGVNVSMRYIEGGLVNLTSSQSLINFIEEFMYGIAVPINTSYEEVKPEVLSSRPNILGWYTIGAIGMMFLYTGFSYGASALYEEKERGTLRRILASPMKPWELIVGIVLSGLASMMFSAVIALIVGLLLGAHIVLNPLNPLHWVAILLLFTGAIMTIGIGIMLSTLAKTGRGAEGLGVVLGLLLSFLAGIWYPTSLMPQWLRLLANVFPPTWVFDTVRNIIVFDSGLEEIGASLTEILVALAVILLLDIIVYKYRLRKYVEEA